MLNAAIQCDAAGESTFDKVNDESSVIFKLSSLLLVACSLIELSGRHHALTLTFKKSRTFSRVFGERGLVTFKVKA